MNWDLTWSNWPPPEDPTIKELRRLNKLSTEWREAQDWLMRCGVLVVLAAYFLRWPYLVIGHSLLILFFAAVATCVEHEYSELLKDRELGKRYRDHFGA